MAVKTDRNLEQEFNDMLKRWDIPGWCKSEDPVCRHVTYEARQEYLGSYTNEEINEFIRQLDEHLQQGLERIEREYFVGSIKGKNYFDYPDSVDLLIHLHEDYGFWGKKTPLKHINAFLHLLCLSESKKGNAGLAVKAYMISLHTEARKELVNRNRRKWNLAAVRDEQNAKVAKDLKPRNDKICADAQKMIATGKTTGETIKALEQTSKLTGRMIRTILRKCCPNWDSGRKYKRF